MATQAALIADTIVGMKRALRRERDDSGPDDAITQPTNRGNKMRANAKYVREGALGYVNAEDLYKEKIEHAGYTRHILRRNPIRYDSEGEELDEEDEDSEADAAAAEDNPFSGIALETLLCPLKHPSELPVHPSLSHAYTSRALEQMTDAVEEKLRQEKALLWRARNLHRRFLGDGTWMPCGVVETADDRHIFEAQLRDDHRIVPVNEYSQDSLASREASPAANGQTSQQADAGKFQGETGDVEMGEDSATTGGPTANTSNSQEPVTQFKSEEIDEGVKDLPQHPTEDTGPHENASFDRNGVAATQHPAMASNGVRTNGESHTHAEHDGDTNDEDAEMHDGSSPEPPRRMTTRAQANANNPSDDAQSSALSHDLDHLQNAPHPLFMIPETVRPDANFGLPPNEAEETRRLLWSYIQKQEETVRGFEHMLECLLRAAHMKANVMEWCKAEGHVGEMSDGEDWYDREKWGLAEGEELKKGTDEDEVEAVDESRTTAKRGRGRRQ
ncbi:Uncharacterized protein PECH_003820 [Penicillium ucsense]|uniref:Transcriptional regulatory protein RXT2 N-terminal domain-containing protein n=1 Tax=Penicillium ucsense TaxID=2839758 RepID=A0A8J8VVR8_9EURO|nr:Uncharacterized protein PECM_003509 [Penicillium ucsense]KAF7729066.1 Uncharacterized protein PECH_003820 [Penicillium ucsense]